MTLTGRLGRDATALTATSHYDYALPPELVAQSPVEPRDASRLLVCGRHGAHQDRAFTELPDVLRPGDLLVVNDTRVRAARLRATRDDGGEAEVLLVERLDAARFTALVRPGRRLHAGTVVTAAAGMRVTIEGPAAGHPGARVVAIEAAGDVDAAIEAAGEAPLPPYIRAPLADRSRYQTIYATGAPASAAAPTAGLHFTQAVRDALVARGVGWARVQLDVGLGTFAPITATDIRDHRMHAERCTVPAETVAMVAQTRRRGGRVIAVGTTAVRTLESHADASGDLQQGELVASLFITPGHRFSVVDGLLTNFHQPRSSLLVLLASFMGDGAWRDAYRHAIDHGYRFLSFGDCMLCWRAQPVA